MEKAYNTERMTMMSNNKKVSGESQAFCKRFGKVMTIFASEKDAEEQAALENLASASRMRLVPSYCNLCGGWHLRIGRVSDDGGILGTSATNSAFATEAEQWRSYRCGNNGSCGHGFAAEDANALADMQRGQTVVKTGLDYSLNGPDRIVDDVKIQTKYCDCARSSVNSAFDKITGMYRYKGQVLEVPKDQYQGAVKVMEEKIRAGRVEGVTDPAEAVNLVRQGHYTYDQAVKIAKAGNLESTKLDARNHAGASAATGAISAGVAFVDVKMHGGSTTDALKASGVQGAKTAGKTMATGVTTQQFLRTGAGRTTTAALQKGANKAIDAAMQTSVGRKVVEKTAEGIGKCALGGTAARNVLSRTASANVVTATAVFGISMIPDTVSLCRGKISGAEFGKRTACNGAGAIGGTSGAWAGAAFGSCICPGIGTAIGGIIGGIFGGIGASSGVRRLFD